MSGPSSALLPVRACFYRPLLVHVLCFDGRDNGERKPYGVWASRLDAGRCVVASLYPANIAISEGIKLQNVHDQQDEEVQPVGTVPPAQHRVSGQNRLCDSKSSGIHKSTSSAHI